MAGLHTRPDKPDSLRIRPRHSSTFRKLPGGSHCSHGWEPRNRIVNLYLWWHLMLSACIIFVHIFTCSIGLWISWMHKVYLFSHLCNKKLLSSYYVKRTRLGTGYMFAASAVTEIQFLSSRSSHFRRKNRHTSKWNVRRGIYRGYKGGQALGEGNGTLWKSLEGLPRHTALKIHQKNKQDALTS